MNENASGHNSAHGSKVHGGHTGFKSANIFPKYDQVSFDLDGAAGPGVTPGLIPIPIGAHVTGMTVEVSQAFDGVPTLEVGDTATAALLAAIGEFDLTTVSAQSKDQDLAWPLNSVVQATLGGASTTGAATITVTYSAP